MQCGILYQGSLLIGKDNGFGHSDNFSETSNCELMWDLPNKIILAVFPFPPSLLIAKFVVWNA